MDAFELGFKNHAIEFANWLKHELPIGDFDRWTIDSVNALTTEQLYELFLKSNE